MKQSRGVTYLLAAGSVLLALLMVKYPDIAVQASYRGLLIWWKSVFPALFPFFVLSELMIGFGVVTFAGTLLEPIMRPLFRVPGIGGFVLMMGMVSGFPAGARMTARLYQEKQLTKVEAERLSSFTNFSNPLFLFSVTAVGFFGQIALGIVFAIAHYLGNIGVGLVMRCYKADRSSQIRKGTRKSSRLASALNAMHRERIENYHPFGKMLGDAVTSSVTTLLAVGGFIALFSMTYQLLVQIGFVSLLSAGLTHLFGLAGLSPALGSASIPGIFELTIGAKQIGETSAPMIERVVLASALLGFCGFSIQAQAISILSQAGLSVKPFLLGRLIQAVFSAFIAFVCYHAFAIESKLTSDAVSTFARPINHYSDYVFAIGPWLTVGALILFVIISLIQLFHSGKADHY
ncbi:sporulation integral membrane protein YlbJ [Sporolactobacillus spathodeae]|uniref:Sporulation integral membrane protein YlbJ n=1 Tax=Sporolactobacillus spathodeae TaxID=1465502 RepID=A0ABS2Q990_9BACL|nr:sporulation integral membrane protein YlbJ [Sporolactobacillus spathodeae]MBM7658303.1 sporulation integral membrane protein YlbJ [Sporolactobacillus spathodeae]